MAWRHVISLENKATGAAITGQTVQLFEGDGSGPTPVGTYTDNGDGTYYLDLSSNGSLIGTIKVAGVIQSEMINIPIIGEDLIDHLSDTSAHDATGGVVGVSKTQTLSNKTFATGSNVHIHADCIDAGSLHINRIPGSIPDSKLNSITSSDKVYGGAIKLASNPALEVDANGLRVKTYGNGLSKDSNGIQLNLGSSPGIEQSSGLSLQLKSSGGMNKDTNGLYIDFDTNPGLELSADGLSLKLKPDGGLSKDATGLFADINASSITEDWQSPRYFDEGATVAQAVMGLDDAIRQLRLDTLATDHRASMLYNQYSESPRNLDSGESIPAYDPKVDGTDRDYFEGDSTWREKIVVPFHRSPLATNCIIRGYFANTSSTKWTKIKIQVYDKTGTLDTDRQHEFLHTGQTWKRLNKRISFGNIADDEYWVVISLQSEDGTCTALLRSLEILMANTAWFTSEISESPSYAEETGEIST